MSAEEAALAEIRHHMQGVRWSLHGVYAFGFGIGVQVKDGSRKIGPVIFPHQGQTMADVLEMLGGMAAEEKKPAPKAKVRTERRLQFWRESEQAWVDHVLIRTWGKDKDEPTKWRHRTITTTITASDWEEGR